MHEKTKKILLESLEILKNGGSVVLLESEIDTIKDSVLRAKNDTLHNEGKELDAEIFLSDLIKESGYKVRVLINKEFPFIDIGFEKNGKKIIIT